ncbi:zinc finger BED domain-containing protein RICESLEEPER 2-like [Senna tora]|uniref:Zinc finger BED domain-containing protein RICESLEEPER 2-like n=1 Tax=Senna tora TaxID=362788 RepID=A0A834SZH6_9FABA|nr:zinc finger BED domain-containing protein RICESLEEPER 2-like [Senna tora]
MLNFWIESNDVMLRNMAKNLKTKLDKYWNGGDNMNYMLFVVVVLDPCHKMAYIEFCFSNMYGLDKCKHMLVKLKELLVNLFEYYQVLYPLPPDNTDSSCLISDTSSFGGGVSLESAFSTGGRVLDPFRSSLNPTTVEALVCAQNCLRIFKKEIDLRSSIDEIERNEAS